MASLKPFFQRYPQLPTRLAYAATVGLFLWVCAQFYLPGKGFTYLIMFGDRDSARFIPQLRAVNHYELLDSPGYDGAHYAQIAMQPHLSDPALKQGVDNLAYRARRILFCWTAYALALGDPVRAMNIYSIQNMGCWLLLGWLLLRWFPAVSWGNFLRWFCVMFSYGICFSLRGSLVDGPSLLLIACGVALAEKKRPWLSAIVLGISALGKETNILGGAALARPETNSLRDWLKVVLRAVIILLPMVLWLMLIRQWLGPSNDLGLRNFTLPLASYFERWRDTLAALSKDHPDYFEWYNLCMLVSLTTQFLFFALRPRWANPWWRVAAAFSIMMIFLGQAVWEGYPSAASRVLLPMTLAFNILVPRGRRWWAVLIMGNLAILASPDMLRAPGRDGYQLEGDRNLRMVVETGRTVEAVFDDKWYPPERSRLEYWRWSNGPSTLVLRNPHPFPILVTVSFGIRAKDARTVGLWQGTYARWERKLAPGETRDVKVRNMRLEPGDTLWRFQTDLPGIFPDTDDPRRLAFSLRDLKILIIGKADVIPAAR
ncbi:MAG: hypothetical protein JWM32_1397 [Verrucomicrobia bacterium]|nr:hypothetical protein [Verrucomicrobiota bacterium]